MPRRARRGSGAPTSAGSPSAGPRTPTRRSRWRSVATATRSWSAAPCTARCCSGWCWPGSCPVWVRPEVDRRTGLPLGVAPDDRGARAPASTPTRGPCSSATRRTSAPSATSQGSPRRPTRTASRSSSTPRGRRTSGSIPTCRPMRSRPVPTRWSSAPTRRLPAWSQAALVLARTDRIDAARLGRRGGGDRHHEPGRRDPGEHRRRAGAARARRRGAARRRDGRDPARAGALGGRRRAGRPRRTRRRPAEAHRSCSTAPAPTASPSSRTCWPPASPSRPPSGTCSSPWCRWPTPRPPSRALTDALVASVERHRGEPRPVVGARGVRRRPGHRAAAAGGVLRRRRDRGDRPTRSAGSAPSWSRRTRPASRSSPPARRSPRARSTRCSRRERPASASPTPPIPPWRPCASSDEVLAARQAPEASGRPRRARASRR